MHPATLLNTYMQSHGYRIGDLTRNMRVLRFSALSAVDGQVPHTDFQVIREDVGEGSLLTIFTFPDERSSQRVYLWYGRPDLNRPVIEHGNPAVVEGLYGLLTGTDS